MEFMNFKAIFLIFIVFTFFSCSESNPKISSSKDYEIAEQKKENTEGNHRIDSNQIKNITKSRYLSYPPKETSRVFNGC